MLVQFSKKTNYLERHVILDLGKNRTHKRVYMSLRKGSKHISSAILEHLSIAAQKMISVRKSDSNGNKAKMTVWKGSFAVLMSLEEKLKEENVCMSDCLSRHSIEIFSKLISEIQVFYNQALPNLNQCMSECSKRNIFKPQTSTNLKNTIEHFFDNEINRSDTLQLFNYLLNQ